MIRDHEPEHLYRVALTAHRNIQSSIHAKGTEHLSVLMPQEHLLVSVLVLFGVLRVAPALGLPGVTAV